MSGPDDLADVRAMLARILDAVTRPAAENEVLGALMSASQQRAALIAVLTRQADDADTGGAERAFEALRAEVAGLRQAVEGAEGPSVRKRTLRAGF